jgi:hypothetical protein
MMVLALVMCERSFLKARHSLRNDLPAGQRYSSALDVELRFNAIDYGLGALDLGRAMSRCGFHRRATFSTESAKRG